MKNSLINIFARATSALSTMLLILLIYRIYGAGMAGKFSICVSLYLASYAALCSGLPYIISVNNNRRSVSLGFVAIFFGAVLSLIIGPFLFGFYYRIFDIDFFSLLLLSSAKVLDTSIEWSYAVNRVNNDYSSILLQNLMKVTGILLIYFLAFWQEIDFFLFSAFIFFVSFLHLCFVIFFWRIYFFTGWFFSSLPFILKNISLSLAGVLAVGITIAPRFIIENFMGYEAAGDYISISQVYIAICVLGGTLLQVLGSSGKHRTLYNKMVTSKKIVFIVFLVSVLLFLIFWILGDFVQGLLIEDARDGGRLLLALTVAASMFFVYRDALTYRIAQFDDKSLLIKVNGFSLVILIFVGLYCVSALGFAGIGLALFMAASVPVIFLSRRMRLKL